MLPGFRFLFVAIMLTLSILICGLGAAALLRVAHEDFASNPSWHAAHETAFAQQGEATGPVLAMLGVDTPTVEKSSDEVSAAAEVPEQAAVVPTPTKSEKVAALNPADSPWSEPAKPEIPVAESPARSEAAPALAYAPAPADETKIAAIEQALPPANGAAPAASEQTSAPASPDIDAAATKIATLGGPLTIAAQPPGKAAADIPDQSAIKKRLQERRVAQRRRMARARLAAQQALQLQQQALNPFAQAAIRAQPAIHAQPAIR
jgi:hypothetical protein